MMWGYISRQYSIEAAGLLLKTLYAHQFKAARDRGLTKGDIEVDTTDRILSTLLRIHVNNGIKIVAHAHLHEPITS
jgi:hypothetical protein